MQLMCMFLIATKGRSDEYRGVLALSDIVESIISCRYELRSLVWAPDVSTSRKSAIHDHRTVVVIIRQGAQTL